jgi:hypothetical protein
MYAFGNRDDTTVVDEPMYAYYLQKSGVIHPGQEEVMASLPSDLNLVLDQYFFNPVQTPYYFIKGMAHHYHAIKDLSFLDNLTNLFLIRDPAKLIASFAQVIPNPTLQDIGVKKEWDLYEFLLARGQTPIILDSEEVLRSPETILRLLCEMLDIPFSEKMLQWNPGPRTEDGVWARFWYQSVWQSTGFSKQKSSARAFPKRLQSLLDEALIYYQKLYENSIKI